MEVWFPLMHIGTVLEDILTAPDVRVGIVPGEVNNGSMVNVTLGA